MSNIAFSIGPLQIHWYGILIAAALIIGYWLTCRNATRYGLEREVLDRLLVRLIVAVIVGARLAFVAANFGFFLAQPWEIIRIDHGGLGSHGAFIAAMLLGWYWTRRARVSYWTLADAVAPAITVGHIFVRIGNFINGELYGPPTNLPWAVKFPTSAVPVHPSQLYEVLTSLAILPFALRWSHSPRYPGYAFLRVLLLHSAVRFFMDFFRQETAFHGQLVLTQYIALAFVLLSGGWLWYLETYRYPADRSKPAA